MFTTKAVMVSLIPLLFTPPPVAEIPAVEQAQEQAETQASTGIDEAHVYGDAFGCDPIETVDPSVQKPAFSKADRKDTLQRVYAECRSWGASREACSVLKLMVSREASGKRGGRHRLPKDSAMALESYIDKAPKYGWYVIWPLDERLICEGEKKERVCKPNWDSVEVNPLQSVAQRNPHYQDPRRWATGIGAIGANPALHVASKVDPMAPPESLCVPEVSARVALKTYQRAVDAYKAKTWVQVAAVFGGRVADNRPKPSAKMDKKFCDRAANWDIDCHADPRGQLGTRIPAPDPLPKAQPPQAVGGTN